MPAWTLAADERASLRTYLATALPNGDAMTIEPVPDQERKLHLAGDDRSYLLQGPRARPTPITRTISEEYAILSVLASSPVPAPAPITYCTDESILGVPFYVMEFLPGEVIPAGHRLPARFATPERRKRIGACLVDTLAAIQAVDPSECGLDPESLEDRLSAYETMLADATAVTERELPDLWRTATWLREQQPPRVTPPALVHGDLLPHNVLFTPATEPAVGGVIDWELATLTDPRTDLGFLLSLWHEADDAIPIGDLEDEYRHHPHRDVISRHRHQGLWPFTSAAGSWSRRQLLAGYEERTGVPVRDAPYFHVLGAFKAAVLWETWHRQRLGDGETAPPWEVIVRYQERVCRALIDGTLQS